MDSFDLSYHRRYRAEGDVLLTRGEGHPVVTIEGFSDAAILLLEVTDPDEPKIINATTVDGEGSEYRVSFEPETSEALYLAVSTGGLRTPVSVSEDVQSDLKASSNRADYLMIAPPELKQAAEALADYRQGGGLETMIVELEDIDDEFNDGISDPGAIQAFIAYAYHNWELAPQYVVLVGDDGVPEMASGRLPVVTAEELGVFIAKLMAYEAAGEGAWREHVLMLADNPDDGMISRRTVTISSRFCRGNTRRKGSTYRSTRLGKRDNGYWMGSIRGQC